MKRIIIGLCACVLFTGKTFSQNGTEHFPKYPRNILDSVMNLKYISHDGYFMDTVEIQEDLFFDYHLGIMKNPHIASEDGNFKVFFDISTPFLQKDSVDLAAPMYRGSIDADRVDKEHIFSIRFFIHKIYGEEDLNSWKKYARYLSYAEAKEKFNADTAIYITFPMKENPYVESYPYCLMLVIQKKGRGFFSMFFVYNDEGKKDLDKHIAAIEHSFRYGEESPLKQKLDDYPFTRLLPPAQKKQMIR